MWVYIVWIISNIFFFICWYNIGYDNGYIKGYEKGFEAKINLDEIKERWEQMKKDEQS